MCHITGTVKTREEEDTGKWDQAFQRRYDFNEMTFEQKLEGS